MFAQKASSKQKRVKMTQEREIEDVVTVHFARQKYSPPWRAMNWATSPGEIFSAMARDD